MYRECDICGQPLTEASGHWRLTLTDFGIYHFPPERGDICAYCQERLHEKIEELAEERRKERAK